jgi:phosphomannomutase/phosphoglucomutase
VLSRNPGGKIIYDVKCTRNLAGFVRAHGGVPEMWRTGHSLVKAKLKETGAPLAGEMSGHIFYKDRWYGFDDGCTPAHACSRSCRGWPIRARCSRRCPIRRPRPELQLRCAEGEHFALVDAIKRTARFEGATEVIDIDGVRVEYPDGFGLARASNTTPVVVMRFEADNAAALSRIQAQFRQAVLAVKPDATLPF